MKKSNFSEAQIVAILKEGEARIPVAQILRKHGISHGTAAHRAAVALHLNRDAAITAAGDYIDAHIARPWRDCGLITEPTHDAGHSLFKGMAAEAIEFLQLAMARCLGTAPTAIASSIIRRHRRNGKWIHSRLIHSAV